MKHCPNCSAMYPDDSLTICPNCKAELHTVANQQYNQNPGYNAPPPPNQPPYGAPYGGNYGAPYGAPNTNFCPNCGSPCAPGMVICPHCGNRLNSAVNDSPETILKVLSFLIPIVGIILYAINYKEKPISAKEYLKWAIISFIVSFCLSIFSTIFIPLLFSGLFYM